MKEFSYAYLLLDIMGVLVCAVGLKFALLHLLILVRRGTSPRSLLCLAGNLCLMTAGFLLVWMPPAWTSFLLVLAAVSATVLCGKIAYTRI